MKQFHGFNKKHSFFEGWYLKHQTAETSISFIPAFHVDSSGASSLSIQIITPTYNGRAIFPAEQFLVNQEHFSIQVGKNHFSDTGIAVDIHIEDYHVQGSLSYGPLTPPNADIMGPFRHIPFLQCNHGLLSLSHSLQGTLDINGTQVDFSGGTGYIEKDWGNSFPKSYLWTQGNWLSTSGSPCCVMLAIAHIPILGAHFTGCICSVYYNNKEYRLATYHRVSVLEYSDKKVVIRQGNYNLSVDLCASTPRPLYAPESGNMTRTIHESVSCLVRYQFTIGGDLLFDITIPNASFESSGLDS